MCIDQDVAVGDLECCEEIVGAAVVTRCEAYHLLMRLKNLSILFL